MKFIAIAALLATAMAMPGHVAPPAAPAPPAGPAAPPSTSIEQSQTKNTCSNAELSCCESVDKSTEITQQEKNSLLDLLGDNALEGVLGKFTGCSSLANVNAIAGSTGDGLVGGGKCNNHVACCNGGDNDLSGLVNVAIPCIPINVA